MALLRRSLDGSLLALIGESGRNVVRTTLLLRELISDYPDRAPLAAEVRQCEHEGDRITHDVIHRLADARGSRLPFDAADGHRLATALDDIVDHAEQVADTLGLYAVEATMEQAIELADVLVGAAEQVSQALDCLRGDGARLPTWWRSTGWRTRATACGATPWRRCLPAGPIRWS